MYFRPLQAMRCCDVDAVFVLFVNIRTELAQGLKMEINRAVANTATSQ